jgi:hypothetical protein
MRRAECGQPRLEPQIGEIGHRRDVQLLRALHVERRRCRFESGKSLAQFGQRLEQFVGRSDPGAPAFEQDDAEIILQHLDPLPDRRRRNAEHIRRRRERSRPRGDLQCLERLQVRWHHHAADHKGKL